jgi:hypothetical protein
MGGWLRVRIQILIVVTWAALPACGKAVDPGAVDGGDDGDDTGDDDGAADAGNDGGLDDMRGLVYVFSGNFTDAGTTVLNSSAIAAFGAYETETCVVELPGAECQVLACNEHTPSSPAPDAGDITIESLEDTVLTPGAGGIYAAYESGDQLLFSDGESVSASALGADVPAFEITLDAPYHIGFNGGVPNQGSPPVDVSAAADYVLFWSAIAPGDSVLIELTGPRDGEGVRRLIKCTVPAGNEQVTLTSSALSRLPFGELIFESRIETSETAMAGDYEVTLTAAVVMRDGGDATFNWAIGLFNLTP